MMKIGKSARYALYAAMDLARVGESGRVTAAEVAARYAIPPAVLAKVLQGLVRAGLAVGSRGSKGGYRLARKSSQMTVLEVLEAFEPRREPGACLLDPDRPGSCGQGATCRLRWLFDEVDELARSTFASITLETLVRTPRPGLLSVAAAPGSLPHAPRASG
jgi:Rrf2 family protein